MDFSAFPILDIKSEPLNIAIKPANSAINTVSGSFSSILSGYTEEVKQLSIAKNQSISTFGLFQEISTIENTDAQNLPLSGNFLPLQPQPHLNSIKNLPSREFEKLDHSEFLNYSNTINNTFPQGNYLNSLTQLENIKNTDNYGQQDSSAIFLSINRNGKADLNIESYHNPALFKDSLSSVSVPLQQNENALLPENLIELSENTSINIKSISSKYDDIEVNKILSDLSHQTDDTLDLRPGMLELDGVSDKKVNNSNYGIFEGLKNISNNSSDNFFEQDSSLLVQRANNNTINTNFLNSDINQKTIPTISEPLNVNNSDYKENFVATVNTMLNKGMQKARLLINPPELGSVNIELKLTDAEVKVNVVTQTIAARDSLDAAVSKLYELFEKSEMNLVDVSVSQHGSNNQGTPEESDENHNTATEKSVYASTKNHDDILEEPVPNSILSGMRLVDAYA